MPDAVPRPAQRTGAARRRARRPRWVWPLAVAAALGCGAARGAAFLPGAAEADPPTGDTSVPRDGAEPITAAGNGIRWAFAPFRYRGSLGLDLRYLTQDDGRRSTQQLVLGDIELRSHIWQPWFIQVNTAVGFLLGRDNNRGADSGDDRSTNLSLAGRLQVSVFPASRFPFEFSAALSDSRATGETLATDYRTLRIGLSQNYRPALGNSSYAINLDFSRANASTGVSDNLLALRGNSLHHWDDHSVDTSLNFSTNSRSDSDERVRQASVSARHGFHPDSPFSADTFANWSDAKLDFGGQAERRSIGTSLLQLSSVMSWRAREGDWLYSATAPVTLGGSVRMAQSTGTSGDQTSSTRQFNAAVGIGKMLSTDWRASGSVNMGMFATDGGGSTTQSGGNLTLSYTPVGVAFGEWRYTPSGSANFSLSRASDGQHSIIGVQGSHSVTRAWMLGTSQSLSFSLSQSLGVVQESPSNLRSNGLAHSAGLFWQGGGDGTTVSFASLSYSESRSQSKDGGGQYRFLNLQVSRRTQLSRYNSWAANFTAQASRSSADQLDAFSGLMRTQDDGWQRYYNGSISFDSNMVFGVPRLRFSALLSANTQQFERRQFGDINAPLEQTTESAEARLDYTVGRLETRLSTRYARIEGRRVAALIARIQRRF